ncbi:hypothetical protein NECAME_11780 [Necator americanus]|uniref:Uncharacterized protein n=1 Tax=Necator americanus TaxID=51031 RepID=W2T412_NECAM|nr:hypothetical protein NECAME_11780 [Necator americanus]ETN76274.1 hypothetical protein NECAME_11780 [Necator americanus]
MLPLLTYFSLLRPEEWAKEEKLKDYVASFRLEMDRSFTPVTDIAARDVQFRSLEAFLKKLAFKEEFNMGVLLSNDLSN